MSQSQRIPLWQRAVILLSGTVVGLIIMVGLQWGRPILIPIAMAILLTFLLNPVVKALQQRGLGRVLSVMIAVSTSGIVMMCLGWMVTRQVAGMLAELPQNTVNIRSKVKTLRELGTGTLFVQFEHMFDEISEEFQSPNAAKAPSKTNQKIDDIRSGPPAQSSMDRTDAVPWLSLTGYLGSALEVLANLAFALVLLVFFLLGREDLRDRIVLLAGKARLAVTSKAMEDITHRISRYIVMVATVNGGFGIVLTCGLFVLQVPYALLWGFVAAGLRFLPYIGPWLGALLPVLMSLATSEGWWQPLLVLGFVVSLELVCNNVVEPLVFRHSTGVSPTALFISAAFWLFLWGPIGLVLSAPFAVCLVVVGKNVPQLGFLNLLMGDVPALRVDVGLYQRLLLGDQHGANSLVVNRRKHSPDEFYDEMLIPALNYAKRDAQRDYLTDEDQSLVVSRMEAALRHADRYSLAKEPLALVPPDEQTSDDAITAVESTKPVKILGCPASDETDLFGLQMLQQLLNPSHWDFEITAVETLTAELVDRILLESPAIVLIASLPPSGMAHARYLCKRLRNASPEIQIIVGRWGQKRNIKVERERLEQAGASFMTTTLLETRLLLESRFPLLTRQSPVQSL